MPGKYISVTLICLLLNLTFYATATANAQNDRKLAEEIKATVDQLGTGRDAEVKIKLVDGTKLKGYVSEIKYSGFVLTSRKTRASKEIAYSQVKQIKGQNSSTGKKTFVRASLIIGAIFLYGYYLSRSSDY